MPLSPHGYPLPGPSSPAGGPSAPRSGPSLASRAGKVASAHRGKIALALAAAVGVAGYMSGGYGRIGHRSGPDNRQTLEAMSLDSWTRGKLEMNTSDEASALMREIDAHRGNPGELSTDTLARINAVFNSPLLTDAVIDANGQDISHRAAMRRHLPSLHVDGPELNAQNIQNVYNALQIARAAIAKVALEHFKEQAGPRLAAVDNDWVRYVDTNLTSELAEPGHLANVVVALWRMGQISSARALATKIFELGSWSQYMLDNPCEAEEVIQNCTEAGLLTNPVSAGDRAALNASCALRGRTDAGVATPDVVSTTQPTPVADSGVQTPTPSADAGVGDAGSPVSDAGTDASANSEAGTSNATKSDASVRRGWY